MSVDVIVAIADALESVATTAALVVGGAWTYMLFVRKRQRYPRAKTSHSILQRTVAPGKLLLTVCVKVENCGEVLLSIVAGEVRVYRLLPLSDELSKAVAEQTDPVPDGRLELPWPRIGERTFEWEKKSYEVEPGECHTFEFDFVIASGVQSIQAYSYVRNVKKRGCDIGWGCTTYHDIGGSMALPRGRVDEEARTSEETSAEAEADKEKEASPGSSEAQA